jgi:hypothetical protein
VAASKRQQRQDQQQQAEGGRVGVGEDEVELGAGEPDRDQHRGRERRRQRPQQLPGEGEEGAGDRDRHRQPQGIGGVEAGAEELERPGQGVDPQRPVEVADVLVGKLPVHGLRRGRQLGAGIDLGGSPLAPADRREDDDEQAESGQGDAVG